MTASFVTESGSARTHKKICKTQYPAQLVTLLYKTRVNTNDSALPPSNNEDWVVFGGGKIYCHEYRIAEAGPTLYVE